MKVYLSFYNFTYFRTRTPCFRQDLLLLTHLHTSVLPHRTRTFVEYLQRCRLSCSNFIEYHTVPPYEGTHTRVPVSHSPNFYEGTCVRSTFVQR